MRTFLFVFLLMGLVSAADANPWWLRGVESNKSDYLPPDAAFRVSSYADGRDLRVRWLIADGYYLYRQKIEIVAESPDLVLAQPALPMGAMKTDPYLGLQEIYRQQIEGVVPYSRGDAGAHPIQIKVTYQGCADAGLCYPPITRILSPEHPPAIVATPEHPWEGVAILGGVSAFLIAGLLLRKGRKLDLPAA